MRKEGLAREGPRLLVYASTETHTWIQKAADLFGLGTDAIRWIATDDEQRMDPTALRRQIEEDLRLGHQPISGRRYRGLGQHRRHRSAPGDRRHLP